MVHRNSVGGGEVTVSWHKNQEEVSRLREVNRAAKALLANQKTKTKTKTKTKERKERKHGGGGGGGGGGGRGERERERERGEA